MSATTTVYVVCDASGEYITPSDKRSPASSEAMEFNTRDQAQTACCRETDTVLVREVDE